MISMNLFNWDNFLQYKKFVDTSFVTEKVYEAVANEPDDATKKKAARIKVEYAGQLLATKFPFFSEILFNLHVIYTYDPRIPTAATDGKRLFINPNFFFPMTQKQVLFVLAHEVMHVALLHTARMKNRDHDRWNTAGDHEINLLLANDIIPLSEVLNVLHGLADERYKGMSAEAIYNDPSLEKSTDISDMVKDKMKDHPPEEPGEGEQGEGEPGQQGQQGQPGQSGSGEDGEEGEGSGEDQGNPTDAESGKPSTGSGTDSEEDDNHPITVIRGPKTGEVITKEEGDLVAKAEGIDPSGEDFPSEDELKDKIRGASQRHLSPTSKSKGEGINGRIHQRIMELTEPVVNWRSELARIIGKIAKSSEFKFPNRRFVASGEYRYGLQDSVNAIENAGVAMDVSGSIAANFPELASEVVGIVKAKKIKNVYVMPFASSVVDPFVIKGFKKPTPDDFEKIRTGGGTEAIPDVVKYVDQHIRRPEFIVIMTDGHLTNGLPKTAPKWGKKCIWLVFDNPAFSVPIEWGRVIHANQDKGYYGR